MPLAANALTTIEAARQYCKISDADRDVLIGSLINAASMQIEKYCRRRIKEAAYVDQEFDGTGTTNLLLPDYPVKEVSAVKIDDVLVPAAEYKLRKEIGSVVRLCSRWPEGVLNVKVSFTAGYNPIPADIELACKHLVMFYFKTDIADFSRTFGEGFVLRPDAMPRQVQIILDPYRKVML